MKASLRKNTSKSIDLEDSGEDIKCREKSPASREDNLSNKRRHRAMIVVDDSDEDCIATMQNKKRSKVSWKKVKRAHAKSRDISQRPEEDADVDYNHTQQMNCDVPEIPQKTKILKRANKSFKRSEETIAHGKRKRRKNTLNMELSTKQQSSPVSKEIDVDGNNDINYDHTNRKSILRKIKRQKCDVAVKQSESNVLKDGVKGSKKRTQKLKKKSYRKKSGSIIVMDTETMTDLVLQNHRFHILY